MKRIALVSVTLNAVTPMTKYISQNPDIHVVNYLDSYILEKYRKENKVTPDTMRRMVSMIAHAAEDGADGIIITCTIFTAYIDNFRNMFPIPVIGADIAMMDAVGKVGGKIAMLCTFRGTEKPSTKLLSASLDRYGKPYEITPYILDDAYEAAQRLDLPRHNRIIQEKALELDNQYDHIVLAQISMAGAADGLKLHHADLYTSPSAAYKTLLTELGN